MTSLILGGSDCALPLIDMDPAPQMRETLSPDADNISTRCVRLENLVEMIAMHVDLVEPEGPATTLEDPSAASEPATPIGDVDENVDDENEATPSMPPWKKRKLVESSVSEPDHGEDNDIFFYHLDQVRRLFLSDLKVILEPNNFMITIDLSDAYMRKSQEIICVFNSRSNVSILRSSIWSQRCSKSIHKSSETSSRNFKISRFQDSSVPQ